MADLPTSTETTAQISQPPGPDNPIPDSTQPDSSLPQPSSPSVAPAINPNPSTQTPPSSISQPQIQPYVHSQGLVPPPSFRPVAPPVPLPTVPQYSPLPNQNFQNTGVQPPGVSPVPIMANGVGSAPQFVPSPYGPPGQLPNQGLRPYVPMPNGYQNMSMPVSQGAIPSPDSC